MDQGTLKPELVTSGDGSHTLKVAELKEHYHSHKGALCESEHVFIKAGLEALQKDEIRLLEVGFGTGLNALLSALNSSYHHLEYHTLETFILEFETIEKLNYPELIGGENTGKLFREIHLSNWNELVTINERFSIQKIHKRLQDFESTELFDLVYYDAFAPHAQPELWDLSIWQKLFEMINTGGTIVTYCAKGQVKRDMKAAGFDVESIPGPPGKREMTRARKLA